jgi:hypothetical protein
MGDRSSPMRTCASRGWSTRTNRRLYPESCCTLAKAFAVLLYLVIIVSSQLRSNIRKLERGWFRAKVEKTPPTSMSTAFFLVAVFSSGTLTACCHSGGKTWKFLAKTGNRWNPTSRYGYATFSTFAGDS